MQATPAAVLGLMQAASRQARATEWPSLETLLTSPDYFGLTEATPLQRAVCRIIEGRPLGELAGHPDVVAGLGGNVELPPRAPREVVLLAAIRSAKSLLTAANAVRLSQVCDLSGLGAGETPRIAIVSLTTDLAQVVFRHIVGNVTAKPKLRALLVGTPTADSLTLRHPSGRDVEIKVSAGSRAGASLVARWLAGVIFDEAPRMQGQDEGVVNLEEMQTAILGRLLPGAQILYPGSPWEPSGPIYDMVQEYWGKPTKAVVVVRGTGPQMNPTHWTPERCQELKERDPDAHATDVGGEFRTPLQNLLSPALIERRTRKEPLEAPPLPGHTYIATFDPATRGNRWTLEIGTCTGHTNGIKRFSIAVARQWTGSRVAPLSATSVLRETAELCKLYGVRVVYTDQYAADILRELGYLFELSLIERAWNQANKLDAFLRLATVMETGNLELPPVAEVKTDLQRVKKRVTRTGVAIELPKSPDGTHCDHAAGIAMLLDQPIDLPQLPPPRVEMTPQRQMDDWRKRLEDEEENHWRRQDSPWQVDAREVGL